MRSLKFVLLLVFGILLLVSIVGGILSITQLFSISIPASLLLYISLGVLIVYLLLVNSELRWQLSRKRDMQKRIDTLARFRQRAITSLYAMTPSVSEFPTWVDRYKKWEKSLIKYLKNNFPFAVFEMFEDLGIIPGELFTHTSNDPAIAVQHQHYLRMLAKHIRILESLIENNTNLLPEAKPSVGELLKWLPGKS